MLGLFYFNNTRYSMEWITLLIALNFYFACTYFSFHEELRRANWFVPVSVCLNIVTSFLWFSTVKYIDEKNKIFFYSLAWDFCMVCIAYFVPILFFNLNLNKMTIAGFLLMIIGLIIIKTNMPE